MTLSRSDRDLKQTKQALGVRVWLLSQPLTAMYGAKRDTDSLPRSFVLQIHSSDKSTEIYSLYNLVTMAMVTILVL